MKKRRLYSQFGLLALANRKPEQCPPALAGDEGASPRAEREPELPRGYRHIRDAIIVLMAAESGWEWSANDVDCSCDRLLRLIHQAPGADRHEEAPD